MVGVIFVKFRYVEKKYLSENKSHFFVVFGIVSFVMLLMAFLSMVTFVTFMTVFLMEMFMETAMFVMTS